MDMPDYLHFTSLHRSSTVRITDVRCRPSNHACGAEEESTSHSIAFPRAGVFVKHLGRQQVVADSSQVVFFNGGETYQVSHPVEGGDDCTSLAFPQDVLLDALSRFEPGLRDQPHSPFEFTHAPNEPKTIFFLQRLRQALRNGGTSGLAVDEMSVDLLAAVIDMAYRSSGRRPLPTPTKARLVQRERAEAAQQFLASQFQRSLSLADVGRAVHYSPYHLARFFRQVVGIPIHQYLIRLRLGAALERLADGAADLTELALDLGYSSHSHFSDAFRRAFGCAPSDFRNRLTSERLRELSKNLKVEQSSRH
jgi:AraC family transcriptional regulator